MTLNDDDIKIKTGPPKIVAADPSHNVVSQGQTEDEAKAMLKDAYELLIGNGSQVTDDELKSYGLDSSDLATRPLPTSFEEFPVAGGDITGQRIAKALMMYGFRPIAQSEHHLELFDIRKEVKKPIIIPMVDEKLDAFVSGFIGGGLYEMEQPLRFVQWVSEVT